ncbi:hypothetical protein FRB94_004766 [Tulasnella sp. JGI-2019a]|nr:hypothetical protein FRB93_004846 [Tulasnella sp. JGI-2019a]KAG9001451.1 hypothetical protein FRB94_004766 [Tulasnella sp. JGI-2019a]KAG9031591.1 hypothetical protein FRB95_002520 [Tulasnella sp. JGI-2019a]
MRAFALISLVFFAGQATAVIFTETITGIGVCWTNPVGPTVTQTVPGATTTTTDTAGTRTETATVEIVSGLGTYTIQPTPPPRFARRATSTQYKTTIIETEVCSETETLTVYPTATFSDPQITSTITSFGHTATATITTTIQLF